MDSNKVMVSLLVMVIMSLGFGLSYAETDEAELLAQIDRLYDKLLALYSTQANIENRIDKFETQKDNVQASLVRLQERGGSDAKIEKRIAKIANIDEILEKLQANKIKNQNRLDNVQSKLDTKVSELDGLETAPESTATAQIGAFGATDPVDLPVITEFRASFIPHHGNSTTPQAGAYWIEPNVSNITSYKLEHQLLNGSDWTAVTVPLGEDSHFIEAQYGSTYSFRISAMGDDILGPVSDIESVTVVDFSEPDDTPPVFGPADDIEYVHNIADLPLFNYTKPTATDAVDGPVDVTCNPDSELHIGTNEIFCYADDGDGNRAHTSFTINVPALEPIDCTIDVMVGSVKEFHPSDCDVSYAGILLDAIPRSTIYGTADIDNNSVVITAPDTIPDLTPSTPSQEILDYLNITADQFVPVQAEPESFGLTISPIYGADRPRIDITVNYKEYITIDAGFPLNAHVDRLLELEDGTRITEITVELGTSSGSAPFGGGSGVDNREHSIPSFNMFGEIINAISISLSDKAGNSEIDADGGELVVRAETDGEFEITATLADGSTHTITVKVTDELGSNERSVATVTGAERGPTGSGEPTTITQGYPIGEEVTRGISHMLDAGLRITKVLAEINTVEGDSDSYTRIELGAVYPLTRVNTVENITANSTEGDGFEVNLLNGDIVEIRYDPNSTATNTSVIITTTFTGTDQEYPFEIMVDPTLGVDQASKTTITEVINTAQRE